jgi:Icc-related predicted phosphoesterase
MIFRRKNAGRQKDYTRVFFATDVHGSDDCWGKFLNASVAYQADVLVMGGDITGKVIVPIVRRHAGGYEFKFQGVSHQVADEDELKAIEKIMHRTGSYPYRTDAEEMAEIGRTGGGGQVDGIALELMAERVRRWLALAEERLAPTQSKLLMGCGNDDPYELDEIIQASEVVVAHDNRVVRIDEHHEMIGLGYANPTPWECPRDIREEELAERISRLAQEVEDPSNCVYCVHVPPVDSQLDTCPQLDASVDPPALVTDGAGQPIMHGAGSTAVRAAIERDQPLASLHGHIHESRGAVKIGRTESFNPGSEYSEGLLRGLILNLTPDSVLSHQFTSG